MYVCVFMCDRYEQFFSFSTTQGWKPPFSIDTEHFEFTPRLQPLNELDVSVELGSFIDTLLGPFLVLHNGWGVHCYVAMLFKSFTALCGRGGVVRRHNSFLSSPGQD